MKKIHIGSGVIQAKRYAVSSHELGTTAPSEFELLLPGRWDGYVNPDGEVKSFVIKPEHLIAAVDHNLERKKRSPKRDLVIDYEHATLGGGEAPAAGWMGNLEVKEGVLYATDVTWTAKARAYIESGEYRYISPVFGIDALDKVTGKNVPMVMMNAALTNEPFFDELQPIVSKDNSLTLTIFSGKVQQPMDDTINWLRNFLGLPLTATGDEIIAELQKLAGQIKTYMTAETKEVTAKTLIGALDAFQVKASTLQTNYNAVLESLALPETTSIEEVKGHIVAGKSNISGLQTVTAKLQQLEQERLAEKFDLIIAKGIETGRITAAQKEDANWMNAQKAWAGSNLISFQEYFTAKAPIIVPVGKITTQERTAGGDGDLSAEDLVIAKAMNVTKEQLVRHNPVQ